MVEFVINSSPSQSTGYTPFYLTYGYEPVTPLDLIKDADQTLIEGVSIFVNRMKKIFKSAISQLQKAQLCQRT